MRVAGITEVLEPEWCRVDPVRVGGVLAGLGTPDRYATVTSGHTKLLRIDVYAYGPDCFAFEDARIWQDLVVVGFGSHVHAVSIADRSVVTIPLEDYYGHMYPTADYLLVASGRRLFRVARDRSVAWKSEVLGIDGVIVSDPGPPMIVGEGEWDPPGGWRSFRVLASTGKAVSAT